MSKTPGDPSPTSALAGLAADAAVTRLVVRLATRDGIRGTVAAEVTCAGKVSRHTLLHDIANFEPLVRALLGDGRASGPVSFHDLVGLAALPPDSEDPLLVLERQSSAKGAPAGRATGGPVSPALGRVITALTVAGAGAVIAGPDGGSMVGILTAIVRMLPRQRNLVLVEHAPRIAPERDAIRLRRLPPDVRAAAGTAIVAIDLCDPPPLTVLHPPVLLAATGRTPRGALARLVPAGAALTPTDAIRTSDTAPLLAWFDETWRGLRLAALYELLPALDTRTGLLRWQLLLGRDPIGGSLIPTGAAPEDSALTRAWAASAGNDGE